MATLSSTDTRAIATDLLRMLQEAAGRSGSSSRMIYSDDISSNSAAFNTSLKKSRGEIDSVVNRLTKFNESIGQSVQRVSDLSRQVQSVNANTFGKLKEQGRTAVEALKHVENALTDTSIIARKYPQALQKAAEEAGSGMQLFRDVLSQHSVQSAEDFKHVSDLLKQNVTTSLRDVGQGMKAFTEWSELLKDTSLTAEDIKTANEGMMESAIQVNEQLKKLGVETNHSTSDIRSWNNAQLSSFMQTVKKDKMMLKAKTNATQGFDTLNKNVAKAGDAISKMDKSVVTLAKDMTFDKIFGKLGMQGTDIENLKEKGIFNLSSISKILVASMIKVGGAAGREMKEIARAAMETGVAPMEGLALKLRMSASEFQRIIGKQSQAAFGGAQGIKDVTAALEENRDTFFKLTGDPKLASELNMKVINFSKSFTEGTEKVGASSRDWGQHLNEMRSITGKLPNEMMDLYQAQMESVEMQEVLNRLDGIQQQKMIAGIRARSKELAAMGLTAEKAVETAVAFEKLRTQTTPKRVEQSMVLARNAMILGMSRENAMRLQQLARAQQLGTPEGQALMKQLADLERSRTQHATTLIEQRQVSGDQIMNMLERQREQLSPELRAILDSFKGAREVEKGKGQKEEDADKRAKETADNKYVTGGTALLDAANIYKATTENVLGVAAVGFSGAAKLFGEAVGDLATALYSGVSGVAGSSGLGTAAVLGIGGVGLYGAGKIAGKAGGLMGLFGKAKGMFGSGSSAAGGGGALSRALPFLKGVGLRGLGGLGLGYGVGEITSSALGLKEGGVWSGIIKGATTGAGAGMVGGPLGALLGAAVGGIGGGLWNAFTGKPPGSGVKTENMPVAPLTPDSSISTNISDFMEQQQYLNQQLALMNTNLQTIAKSIAEGNTFASQTTKATKDLADAYYSVESAKISNEALRAGQMFREKLYAGSNVRPIHV